MENVFGTDLLMRMANIISKDSNEALAAELNCATSNITNIRSRPGQLPKTLALYEFCQRYHVSMDWLLTGKGKVYLSDSDDYYKIPPDALKRWPILKMIIAAAQSMDCVLVKAACKRAAETMTCPSEESANERNGMCE